MYQPLDELVLGSVTLVSYPDRIEIFINDTPGLVKSYIYSRTPDLRMSLLTKVSTKGTETCLIVCSAVSTTMGALRTVEFNLGDKFGPTDLIIAGVYAKLNEFMGMGGPGGFGYGGAQFAQPGYGPGQGTYTNPNGPQQHGQWDNSQQGWN